MPFPWRAEGAVFWCAEFIRSTRMPVSGKRKNARREMLGGRCSECQRPRVKSAKSGKRRSFRPGLCVECQVHRVQRYTVEPFVFAECGSESCVRVGRSCSTDVGGGNGFFLRQPCQPSSCCFQLRDGISTISRIFTIQRRRQQLWYLMRPLAAGAGSERT